MYEKTPDTLVEDIYKLFEGPHKINEENLDLFVSGVRETLKTAIEEAGTKDTKALRMSVIGLPNRKLWYMMNTDVKQVNKPSDYIKFLFGHILEHLVLLLVREAGHVVEDEQKKVELEGVEGTIDCKIDGVLVDVKSASNHGIKKFKNDTLSHDDPFGYLGQISGYTEALGDEEAAFLIINKENGELVFRPVDSLDIIDASSRIKELKEVISSDTIPERCFEDKEDGKSGNRILTKNCEWCAYKFPCWSDANGGEGLKAYQYSNGLRYFTQVVKEPRVDEVEV